MIRILSELFWSLRRAGIEIATSQAIDAAKVVALLGFDERARLRDGLEAVFVRRARDQRLYREAFDAFFSREGLVAGDLYARLAARGFGAAEIDALRELLHAVAERSGQAPESLALRALTGSPQELDHLLRAAGLRRAVAGLSSKLQLGYYAEKASREIGVPRAQRALERVRDVLREALGDERGDAMARALEEELAALRRRVRSQLEEELDRRAAPELDAAKSALDVPFEQLDARESVEVRRAVKRLAERLRGAARVREKRARRGRIDARRTARRALATMGVPFVPARRKRRRDKPKLVVVCDVSESVRAASRFMLELVSAVAELYEGTRSFVFVSELAEATPLFRGEGAAQAMARILSGELVPVQASSNYARAFAALERELAHSLDRRTTIVVLGDGRTNHQGDGAEVLLRLRERAKAVLWLCPEDPSRWGVGDSAMPRYAAASTAVLGARTARELERAARRIVALG